MRYDDCQRQDGNCTLCSLVNYGRDCHNNPISDQEWTRLVVESVLEEHSTEGGQQT